MRLITISSSDITTKPKEIHIMEEMQNTGTSMPLIGDKAPAFKAEDL